MKKPVARFVKIKGGYMHKETLLTTLTGQDAKKLEKHMDEYGSLHFEFNDDKKPPIMKIWMEEL